MAEISSITLPNGNIYNFKATKDGDGNIITSHYVTLSTNQTILGQKTFTNTVTIGNSISNNDSKIVVNDFNINMTDQNNDECFFLGFSETTGNYYHNEGVNNQISGNYSYTYGQGLISDNNYQMVIGKYNQTYQSENYVFVIGNGTSENDRASIFSIGDRGQIRIHNSDITISNTPSSTYTSYAIRLGDSNGDRFGDISYYYGTDGTRGISIQGYRKVSDVDYFNTLRLSLDTNHNPVVVVSSAAAWRSALNLNNVLDLTRVTEFRQANVTIDANTSTTVVISYTVPSGFDNGRTIAWRIDSTDTTSAANQSWCVVTNHWIATSDNKIHATIRNFASSQAKVTVNIKVLFLRTTL